MKIISSFLFLLTFHLTVFGADYYASPTGLSTNSGAIGSPWDLQTALGKTTECAPGNTFYLRGGTYSGKFRSTLDGCTVRSYTGEWAVIDGYKTTTLTSPINASQRPIPISSSEGLLSGEIIAVDTEIMQIDSVQSGTSILVNRGWGGSIEGALSHLSGASVIHAGNQLLVTSDETYEASDTTYQDFEVKNSYTQRDLEPRKITGQGGDGFYSIVRGAGVVQTSGNGNSYINLLVNNNLNGFFVGSNTSNTLFYGNLITNNGGHYAAASREQGAGHGLYLENRAGYSRVYETISINNFNYSGQFFGVTGPYVGGDIRGSVFANAGSPLGCCIDPNIRAPNVLYGPDSQVSPTANIVDSHFFAPYAAIGGTPLLLGYGAGITTATATGNTFVGGPMALTVRAVNSITFTNNKIYSQNPISDYIHLGPPKPETATWDSNTYYDSYGRSVFCVIDVDCFTFPQWKAQTGYDATSTETSTAMPDTVTVRPNTYETGRANIIIYAPSGAASVNVDLSTTGLTNGQNYTIKNAFNWYGSNVATGTYNSSSPTISVPLNAAATTVAEPTGLGFTPVTTAPQFVVLVVKPIPRATRGKNADFDGDRRTDLSVFRPTDSNWYVLRSSDSGYQVTAWGLSTDILTPGDYDGDGKTDQAVFRPSDGVWWILQSSTNTWATLRFGQKGDIPVPGDYDGDGKTDRAIWRRGEGTWWVFQSTNQKALIVKFGENGDIPLVGDFDGDRKADFAFVRPSTNSTWNILRSTGGTVVRQFGASDDKLVPADYDGDGTTDFGVWRPSTGIWYTAPSSELNPGQNFTALPFGQSGDIPVPGDYNGDRKYDRAVFRSGTWWIQDIPNNTNLVQSFGASGDKPVPNAYVPE